jgi:putative ABC transport system substrate-binding protein
MNNPRRIFLRAAALLLSPAMVDARDTDNIPIVGVLRASSALRPDPALDAIRGALRRLGYIDGQNLKIEQKFAERHADRLPQLADELVRMKVKVIIAVNEASLRAAKQATATIPIVVIAYDHDPVASGLIDSMTRPGGNVTGIFSRQVELVGKRLELLKETIPGLSRVAVLHDAASRPPVDLEAAGKRLELQLLPAALRGPNDFAGAITLSRANAQGATLLFSPMLFDNRNRIAALAINAGLPLMSQEREFVVAGALMSYAPDRTEIAERTAYFVDRPLRNARPGDLPVEEATRFKLAINLKTANALGIRIPQSVLQRADEVIK